MKKNMALMIAGVVFTLVAIMHLLRLYFQFEIVLGGYSIPLWVNAVGFIIAAVLAFLMFKAQKS